MTSTPFALSNFTSGIHQPALTPPVLQRKRAPAVHYPFFDFILPIDRTTFVPKSYQNGPNLAELYAFRGRKSKRFNLTAGATSARLGAMHCPGYLAKVRVGFTVCVHLC
jgi:hypothetical protein